MPDMIEHDASVPAQLSLKRLDHIAAALFPQYSRSRLQQWIESGELTADGQVFKSSYKVSSGVMLRILAKPDVTRYEPEEIALDIVYEDEAVIVINKPAGLVVHPGAGNQSGTLLNALLHYCPSLASIPRAGIVHRLDKNTTGLMVVARTLESQNNLVQQLQSRSVKRIYEAVVYGIVRDSGVIDAAIARHPHLRTRMSVQENGKDAITHYRPLRTYPHHSHIELSLETGRTHQIRVHMQYRGYPLIGDPDYGGTFRCPPDNPDARLVDCLRNFPRQALHAKSLSFVHPEQDKWINFNADSHIDVSTLLELLNQNSVGEHG